MFWCLLEFDPDNQRTYSKPGEEENPPATSLEEEDEEFGNILKRKIDLMKTFVVEKLLEHPDANSRLTCEQVKRLIAYA
jgi:hypothetical protein